ncbi:hypothetical protein [Bifidobacterium callitrichos]|uniref:hypothetical protein n=1 Tax=Bifidobacterium callitrichos TaxID=762209 RepID=UPI001CC2822A|nr:hypothetical protein [Bifidobacterium callitrichos]
MEGSICSPEQTAQLYDTGALLPENGDDQIRADDVVEMRNYFRAFNWILDYVEEPVDRSKVCTLHAMLKRGMSQELDPDHSVGGYKILLNVISQALGVHTALPRRRARGDEICFRPVPGFS